MITALFRRIFYADTERGPSLPATDNRQDGSLFPERSFDVLIARRAERMANRDRQKADAFIRTHTILKEGRK